jgi:hypothetical protein
MVITALYFLVASARDPTHQGKGVNGKVKPTVNVACCFSSQSEFGLEEEYEDCHHGIESKSFSHVREEGHVQSFGMSF